MKNKIKTILFASLVAAMILPFSIMNMAEAAPEEDPIDQAKLDKIAKIQESIEYYDKVKEKSEDVEKKQKLEKTNQMLDILVELETLDYQGLGNSSVLHNYAQLQ